MVDIRASLVAVLLLVPCEVRSEETKAIGAIMSERQVRALSAGNYSELLRIACINGWKFRRSDVEAGFRRHFQETRLALVDGGVTIVPLAEEPRLQVTALFFGTAEPSGDRDRRGCYRARWREPAAAKNLALAPPGKAIPDASSRDASDPDSGKPIVSAGNE